MSDQNGIMPNIAATGILKTFAKGSTILSFIKKSDILPEYTFMAITAQKLIWKPDDNGQKGSAKVMTIDARLNADNQSLSAKRQMLIIAALVTESLQPVRQPIKRQNTVWTMNAFFRLIFNTLSTKGRHAIKPAK